MAKRSSAEVPHKEHEGAPQQKEHKEQVSHKEHPAHEAHHEHSAHHHGHEHADHKHHDKQAEDTLSFSVYQIFAICAVLLLAFATYAYFKTGETIVAKVNDEPIYLSTLDKQWQQLPAQFKEGRTKKVLLNASIAEVLTLQEAKRLGIEISDTEADAFLEEALASAQTPKDVFFSRAEELGMSEEEVRAMFKARLTSNRLFEVALATRVLVSEDETKVFYEANKAELKLPLRVRASHILVKDKALALKILNLSKSGANFSDLAREHSTDLGSKVQGGDLGFFSKGKMVPQFEAVAFNLSKGQMSDPVESEFGWHIIKLTDKRLAGTPKYDEIKDELQVLLRQQKAEKAIAEYMIELEQKAVIEILWKEEYN